jgi:WD40 repeat protein
MDSKRLGEIRGRISGVFESQIEHTDTVQWLAFTNDGKTLASTGGDRTVKLWDVATGDLKSTLTGLSEYTYCVAFSPDDRTMATGSLDQTVRLWHTATDAEVQSQRSQVLK